jgi:hypothetical protein
MTADIWQPKYITMFKNYALGNDSRVLKTTGDYGYGLAGNIMLDKNSNSLIRERVVALIEGVEHSSKMHDYDGYNHVTKKSVEIKNEQHTTAIERRSQVSGGAAFSGIEDVGGVQRLIEGNPEMYLSGWIDGRLCYTVSFVFNDTVISERLLSAVSSRKKSSNKTAPKFLSSDWIYYDFDVTYFSPKFFNMLRPHCSQPLMEFIESKWQFQKKQ